MDPCKMCCDYPYWCRCVCADKVKYMDEVDGDVPIIRNEYRVITSELVYENGKKYEYNKNGIRREIC